MRRNDDSRCLVLTIVGGHALRRGWGGGSPNFGSERTVDLFFLGNYFSPTPPPPTPTPPKLPLSHSMASASSPLTVSSV